MVVSAGIVESLSRQQTTGIIDEESFHVPAGKTAGF
jgi:hypothetical protein